MRPSNRRGKRRVEEESGRNGQRLLKGESQGSVGSRRDRERGDVTHVKWDLQAA